MEDPKQHLVRVCKLAYDRKLLDAAGGNVTTRYRDRVYMTRGHAYETACRERRRGAEAGRAQDSQPPHRHTDPAAWHLRRGQRPERHLRRARTDGSERLHLSDVPAAAGNIMRNS